MINDVFEHELTANTFVITVLSTHTFLQELTRSIFQLFSGNTLSDKTLISEKFQSNTIVAYQLSVVGTGRVYQFQIF